MSLVGPRPEMHHIVRRYHVWQHARHLMLPGLTCIWQTEARGRYPLDSPEATLLDLQYIRSASSATDAKIIARTFGSVIFGRGAV
jgi:lipopolysaccharide/colanic/teichoic acid biosynthesis glycosyltransferase